MAATRLTLHSAQSLDGGMGARGGRMQLSCAAGVAYAHRLRATHDAVVVGIETVRTDDPLLSVRDVAGESPMPVVLSSTLALPSAARLRARRDLLVIGVLGRQSTDAEQALIADNIAYTLVAGDEHGAAPDAVRQCLAARGKTRILVEGGARVLASFLNANAFEELSLELCPVLLGAHAPAIASALAPRVRQLDSIEWIPLGEHMLVRGRRRVTLDST
jgi:riboflavin-specific deaminase-like protein